MTTHVEQESQFVFRQTIEKLENDARRASEISEYYAQSTPGMERDRLKARTAATIYNHVLHLMDTHLGKEWGKTGLNNID